jgi:hypothetical protein
MTERLHRSSGFTWLLAKEWRELVASRAWWLMLALTGPLVGVCFINAVRAFAEVSAGAGTGCGIVCDPLIGVWAPTFSAYEVAAIVLLPFVAIRLVAGDRQSGALKLELQRSMSPYVRVLAKGVVLAAGWVIATTAALVALALWASYGGSLSAPALLVVATGHLLNAGLAIALGVAAASITEHPATAAIVTLSVTVGTWILALAAAVYGGFWSWLSGLTPVAMVTLFQHGLIQANVTLVAIAITLAGFGVAAIWIRLGVPVRRRAIDTLTLAAATTAVVAACAIVRGSVDVSEGRLNSFTESEEETLEQLPAPLTIEAHLAPQDPRRLELERRPFAKLRRALPSVAIRYIARTSSGLYEQADPGYGEVWYEMSGRREMSRMVTDEGVLEAIFAVATVTPSSDNDMPYMGHPLVAEPKGAALIFYGLWPIAVAATGFVLARRRT